MENIQLLQIYRLPAGPGGSIDIASIIEHPGSWCRIHFHLFQCGFSFPYLRACWTNPIL